MTVARRLGLVALAAATVVGVWAAYMWVRDLSLLGIDHVTIDGADSREAPVIERALTQTARRMTILHVRKDELEHAVDSFPQVRSMSTSTDFPNTLHIKVIEYQPVAALDGGDGRRVSVAASGVLLRGVGPNVALPVVAVNGLPQGRTLGAGPARSLVSVLGGAPAALRPLLARAYVGGNGVQVPVRNGPVIVFGKPTRIAAKWASAARVLADPGAGGAHFIDVRLPERPAASQSAPRHASSNTIAGASAPAVAASGAIGATGASGAEAPGNTQP